MGHSLHSLTNEVDYIKQHGINNNDDQSEKREREFLNALKVQQSEWMENIRSEFVKNNEDSLNDVCNKLDEMSRQNKTKQNEIYQIVKDQQIKLDSLNANYFQTLFDE